MPTRAAVRQAVGRRTGIYLSGTSNATGGAAGTFLDTDHPLFASSVIPARVWLGCWILDTTVSPAEERMISAVTSAGTVSVSPNWSGAADTDAYELYSIMQPTYINSAIDDALRRLSFIGYIYPSLCVDGDVEASGTSDWSSSSATLSKVTTAARLTFGRQALRVLATAAAGYAQSTQIPVTAGEVYEIDALVSPDIGTARLQAYDNTGSASIDTRDSVGEAAQWLHLTVTIPASSRDLRIRLVGVANTDDAYWSLILVRHQGSRRLMLPRWLTSSTPMVQQADLLSAEQMINLGRSLGTEAYSGDSLITTKYQRFSLDNHPDSNNWFINLPYSPAYPTRIQMRRPMPTVSADTDDIALPPELIEAETILEVYRLKEQLAPAADIAYWRQKRTDWEGGKELNSARAGFYSTPSTQGWAKRP